MSVSQTGKDTVIINGRILRDLADADVFNLDFANDLVSAKVGKNNNTIYAYNSTGLTVDATMRIIAGSPDDKYLNSLLKSYVSDPASFTLISGEFIKRVGDGTGEVTNITYQLNGGVIKKMPNAKENVEGDVEQAIAEWVIIFSNADRNE
jgi:hypothetical protein